MQIYHIYNQYIAHIQFTACTANVAGTENKLVSWGFQSLVSNELTLLNVVPPP